MKRIAENACRRLAALIFGGDSSCWEIADRIERRWNIQGATDSLVSALERKRAKFLAEERRQLIKRNPELISVFH